MVELELRPKSIIGDLSQGAIITISGELGSGKSTVSKLIASQLGFKRFSTGDFQRQIAAEMGLTSLQLNLESEKTDDIDFKIDQATRDLAETGEDLVVDSRLAWHFLPGSFKVYIKVDPRVGAERVLSAGRGNVENYADLESASAMLAQRRESEIRRFRTLYGIDLEDLQQYDLVADSSGQTPEEVTQGVIGAFKDWLDARLTSS